MNTVRWQIYSEVKALGIETHITYGAVTKRERNERNIEKSHANDAYCIGGMRPKNRTKNLCYEKRRRNNRILEKFYDAKYIDTRDGSKKSGSQLGCNRTNRRIPRNNPQNERMFRGQKVSKGRVSIRKRRYPINNGDIVYVGRKPMTVSGTAHYGEYVHFGSGVKDIKSCKVRICKYASGWVHI
jgi:hypothetical protein